MTDLFAATLRTGDVAEAVKCYSCTSSELNCKEYFFWNLGIYIMDDCNCCKVYNQEIYFTCARVSWHLDIEPYRISQIPSGRYRQTKSEDFIG